MKAIYRTLFGWMAAAALLLTPSCKDEFIDPYAADDEMVTVTFTVATQSDESGTRAKQDDETPDGGGTSSPTKTTHISDGQKADVLIYAVYDQDYNLLTSYGMDPEDLDDELAGKGFTPGEGQTIIPVSGFPVENQISIRLLRGKTYHIAFWAQNSECRTYNTQDLKQVEMIYGVDEETTDNGLKVSGSPNNDETRDAFCNVATVSSDVQRHQTVVLYRPLAQINVGTSGYDFEIATRGTHSPKYRYSKIEIIRAARYLNVVEDKIVTSTTESEEGGMSTEALASLTYDWAPIPAYYGIDVPEDPSLAVTDEEFLKVDLNKDKTISDYVSLKTYNENNAKLTDDKRKEANYTETFKYLSMCYILVPVQSGNEKSTDLPGKGDGSAGGGQYTTTLDNVTVYLSADPKDESATKEIVKLNNVPVHRNWRTNIISQELLTSAQTLTVNLEPMYDGDYNIDDFGDWSGPISRGVYYDGVNDELLISNAEGLLWLQRMVNGKYDYPVIYPNGTNGTFSDPGIQDPVAMEGKAGDPYGDMSSKEREALKARIMHATHQDRNRNTLSSDGKTYEWPKNNNFHFMHYEATQVGSTLDDGTTAGSRIPHRIIPAKVRLTEDIDLSGYKWIPIGWANNTAETSDIFDETRQRFVGFCGEFNGGNHTIRNLENMRFAASVHDDACQKNNHGTPDNPNANIESGNTGPYDKAVQWFAVGLFGQIGQSGSVSNLRLSNVDLEGYCHVGGIAGILTGPDAYITNCYVDGGSIIALPMYRGDTFRNSEEDKKKPYDQKGRTFARGIFVGGIVGYLNVGRRGTYMYWNGEQKDNKGLFPDINEDEVEKHKEKYKDCGSVTNCNVRNLTLRAYRQIGGIAGAINIYDNTKVDGNKLVNGGTSRAVRKIENCNVSNVTIIADKFQPYDVFYNTDRTKDLTKLNFYKNGFGWQADQLAWSDILVGGDPSREVEIKGDSKSPYSVFQEGGKYLTGANNTSSDVTITEFATGITSETEEYRITKIQDIPLQLMPMLSSWFTDSVTFYSNFTGTPSAYRQYKTVAFAIESRLPNQKVLVPFDIPNKLNVDWVDGSGRAGLYVESIGLTGQVDDGAVQRDRSTIVVEGATTSDDCALYIGARYRGREWWTLGLLENPLPNNGGQGNKPAKESVTPWQKQPTIIKHLVVRGHPYAYTGITLAPNTYTSEIYLDHVAVYDVYQTLALYTRDVDDDMQKRTPVESKLTVKNSNLRGYTTPGENWKQITFENTTFERGAQTGKGNLWDAYTYKVDATHPQDGGTQLGTTFTKCWFKAPYIIEIKDGAMVTFRETYATAATTDKIEIKQPAGCTKIIIGDDGFGKVTVEYETESTQE